MKPLGIEIDFGSRKPHLAYVVSSYACGKRLECCHTCKKNRAHPEPCGHGNCSSQRLFRRRCGHDTYQPCSGNPELNLQLCTWECAAPHSGRQCGALCCDCGFLICTTEQRKEKQPSPGELRPNKEFLDLGTVPFVPPCTDEQEESVEDAIMDSDWETVKTDLSNEELVLMDLAKVKQEIQDPEENISLAESDILTSPATQLDEECQIISVKMEPVPKSRTETRRARDIQPLLEGRRFSERIRHRNALLLTAAAAPSPAAGKAAPPLSKKKPPKNQRKIPMDAETELTPAKKSKFSRRGSSSSVKLSKQLEVFEECFKFVVQFLDLTIPKQRTVDVANLIHCQNMELLQFANYVEASVVKFEEQRNPDFPANLTKVKVEKIKTEKLEPIPTSVKRRSCPSPDICAFRTQ